MDQLHYAIKIGNKTMPYFEKYYNITYPLPKAGNGIHRLRKTVEKVSPILVTLTSCSDSDVESSNVNLKENEPDGVNPNSNDIDYYVRKNEGKILWFSADCTLVTF